MLALAALHGDDAMVARIRQMHGKELPKELARILDALHLRECTTWCFTKEGTVESDQRVLSDFCPGHFVRTNLDPGKGMMSSSLEMAKALDIPSNINVLVRSDSTLRTYVTPNSERDWLATRKNMEMFRHINTCPL